MKLIQGKDKLTRMTSNSQGKAVLIDNGIRMRRDKMKDGLMRRRRDRELTVSQKMQREVNKSRRLRGRRDEAGAPVIRENVLYLFWI